MKVQRELKCEVLIVRREMAVDEGIKTEKDEEG
jgi:hypothetical protein